MTVDKKTLKRAIVKRKSLLKAIAITGLLLFCAVTGWLEQEHDAEYWIFGIMMSVFACVAMWALWMEWREQNELSRNIELNKFRVLKTAVVGINDIKDEDNVLANGKTVTLRFKNCKKVFYGESAKYGDVHVGDEFFVVDIKGYEGILVYKVSEAVLDNELSEVCHG